MTYFAKITLGLSLACLFLFQAAGAAAANDEYILEQLDNGLEVLIIPDQRFPLVSLRLYVHAGSGYETPDIAGISHALEHMVFKGTEHYPKAGVSEVIESLGGYFNAYTTLDHTCYVADLPDRAWREGMAVLKDMAFLPTLDPKEIAPELEVIVEEIQRGKDNPSSELFKMIQSRVFADTTYAWPVIGNEDTVRSFTSQKLRAYIDTHYKPGKVLLLACGNVNPDEVLAAAREMFGQLKAGEAPAAIAAVDPVGQRRGVQVAVEHKDVNQVYLSFAFPIPGVGHADEAGLDVLAQVLGGDATSYLYRKYQYDLRLVEQIHAYIYTVQGAGVMYFSAVLQPENLEEFWKNMAADLAALDKLNFSSEDLNRAKLNLEDYLYRSKETLADLATKEGYFYFLAGGPNAEELYLQQIRAATAPYLQSLAAKYILKDGLCVAAIMPQGLNAPDLAALINENWKAPTPVETVSDAALIAPGQPELIALGDGRTVILLKDDTLPYTAVNIVFMGGNSLLKADEQGLASLSNAALTLATQTRGNEEMERYLSDRAAAVSAGAGRHTTMFSASFPARFSQDILGLIAEIITSPAFAQSDFELAKQTQLAGIKKTEDSPTGLMFRQLYPFLFKDHSYGFFTQGLPEQVAAFTPADALRFWTVQSVQPWTMAVCGQFDREEILKFAQSLPQPVSDTVMPPSPTWTAEKELILRLPGRNQTHVLLLFPTVPEGHEDATGLKLLETALSGMSGPLFLQLREQQSLAYAVNAMNWNAPLAGFMAFYIGTSPDKSEQAMAGFNKIIADIQATPLSAEDLERAVNQMEGEYYRGIQTLANRSAEAATLQALGLPLTFHTDNIVKARSYSPEDLRALVNKYLDPDRAYLIEVLPNDEAESSPVAQDSPQ